MPDTATVLIDNVSGLPAEVTGFIGRRQDRSDVRRLLSSSRLVTLTGFGGIGKTRLALRVAGDVARTYRDGVWFVPFAELTDQTLVAEAVAAALGIEDHSNRVAGSTLAEQLRERELLLVFDNCEHVIDGCAALAETLLRGCPGVRILATSREALRVQGEAVKTVLPLSVPSRIEGALAGAEAYESVQLLVDRASLVAPDFVLGDENTAAIIEICRHLDGIPLALELAAVRLRVMSPGELLQELREHWRTLDVGIRAAPDRHQTMSACLDWSYALCSELEQELWSRLSVFVGGMELDAVYEVACEPAVAIPQNEVVQVLQALVDKSILSAEESDDRMRYHMLEVIRMFGAERLAHSGYSRAMLVRHRDLYATMLVRFDDEWMSPGQIAAMRRVRREDANIRAALGFCCSEPGEAALGLEMAARLRKYSMAFGWFSEDRVWLHRLLPLVTEPRTVRFDGLHAACWLAVLQGDREAATALLAECRDLAGRLDETTAARAAQLSGWHELFLGDPTSASAHLLAALEGFKANGWLAEQAETLVLLGMAYGFDGALADAAGAYEECLRICTDGANPWARSYALQWGGLIAWEQGDQARAEAWERESLLLKRRIQERLGVALSLEALACIRSQTRPGHAATMLGAGTALLTRMGSSPAALPGLFRYHELTATKLKETLGDNAYATAFRAGESMSVDGVFTLALGGAPDADQTPPAPSGPSDSAATELTRREREVAELVAEGLSNKEIATRLVVSIRTAESHVEHILIKLGFTSRTQIAAWVSRYLRPRGIR